MIRPSPCVRPGSVATIARAASARFNRAEKTPSRTDFVFDNGCAAADIGSSRTNCYSTFWSHPSQSWVTLWTVRAACVLYVLAARPLAGAQTALRSSVWTLAFACYLGHVVSAFAFHYDWSHRAAYAETARQTAGLFKIQWGGGLYFNYLFTAIWAADVFWMWANPASYRSRPRWIGAAVHVVHGIHVL